MAVYAVRHIQSYISYKLFQAKLIAPISCYYADKIQCAAVVNKANIVNISICIRFQGKRRYSLRIIIINCLLTDPALCSAREHNSSDSI